MPPAMALGIFILFTLGVAVTAMQLGRIIQARMIHSSLRQAITIDRNLAEALAGKLVSVGNRPEPRGDDRNGLVLIAIGLAAAGYGLVQQDEGSRMIFGIALFPLFVGVALLVRHAMVRRAVKKPTSVE